MADVKVGRAFLVTVPIIAAVISALFVISYLLTRLLGLPHSLNLPLVVRLVGGVILLSGLSVMGWVFKHRGPLNVMVSTHITLIKLLRRTPVSDRTGRTEPLVVSGPQKYVRSPLYFGVVVFVLGWAILTAYTFIFAAAIIIFLWFDLVLIPFEEKELRALFGDEWVRYAEKTPMLIPFTKRMKQTEPSPS